MKDTGDSRGPGQMKGRPGGPYYKAWAEYLVKFLVAYEKSSIDLWGMTVQNEPTIGYIPQYPSMALVMNAEIERDFIKYDLGPALARSNFTKEGGFKLMIFDDDRAYTYGTNKMRVAE